MKFKPNLFVYILAGLLFFLFWMVWVFPYDALQSRIITEIENQTRGRYQLDMKDMDVSLLGSVTFKNLKLKERVAGEDQLLLDTPRLELGFSPLGLLRKKQDFSFTLQGKKSGSLEGDFKREGPETLLRADFDDYPVSELKFIMAKADLSMKGTLLGGLDLQLNSADPAQNKGQVEVNFKNIALDAMSIAIDPQDPASAIEVPAIRLSADKGSHLKARVVRDNFEVDEIVLTGGDIDLHLKGRISMQGASPSDYRMALEGGFKVSESLSKALPMLFILEKQKNADGVYPLSLSGRMGRPNIRIGKFRVPL